MIQKSYKGHGNTITVKWFSFRCDVCTSLTQGALLSERPYKVYCL
jgi:hypothetical protein